jgi:hypothetical protein
MYVSCGGGGGGTAASRVLHDVGSTMTAAVRRIAAAMAPVQLAMDTSADVATAYAALELSKGTADEAAARERFDACKAAKWVARGDSSTSDAAPSATAVAFQNLLAVVDAAVHSIEEAAEALPTVTAARGILTLPCDVDVDAQFCRCHGELSAAARSRQTALTDLLERVGILAHMQERFQLATVRKRRT